MGARVIITAGYAAASTELQESQKQKFYGFKFLKQKVSVMPPKEVLFLIGTLMREPKIRSKTGSF